MQTLNSCHLNYYSNFSLKRLLTCLFFVLLSKKDLHIKEKWHKQSGEEKEIEKEETSLEKR